MSEEDTLADAYIIARVTGRRMPGVPILDGLPLYLAIDAMERVGSAALQGARGALSKFPDSERPHVVSTGYQSFLNWPNNFWAALDPLISAPHIDSGKWGAANAYGYFYTWAKGLPQKGAPIREALFAHYTRHMSAKRGSIISANSEQHRFTLLEVSRQCDMTQMVTRKCLQAMGYWPRASGRGRAASFPVDVLDHLRGMLSRSMTATDFAQTLGLKQRAAAELYDFAYFPRCPIFATMRTTRPRFDRPTVLAGLAKLRGGAPGVDEVAAGLVTANRAGKGAKVGGLREVCELIRTGEIRVHGILKSAVGISAILVDPDEIRAARRKKLGGGASLREASKLLGLNKDRVAEIVQAKLLEGRIAGGEILISHASIAHFRAHFVTGEALAREVQTVGRWLRPVLDDAGIKPAYEWNGAVLWRREDIPADIRSRFDLQYPRSR